MLVKVTKGKTKKVKTSQLVGCVKKELGIDPDTEVVFPTDELEVFVGEQRIVDIDEAELVSKSIKQILKEKGFSGRNMNVEIVKDVKKGK